MRRQSDSWKSKVHPSFLEIVAMRKEAYDAMAALGKDPPAALIEQALKHTLEKFRKINERYPDLRGRTEHVYSGIFSFGPRNDWSDVGQRLMEQLCWQRYRIPLANVIQAMRQGDLKAFNRWVRIRRELHAILFEHRQPKKFKGDPKHLELFQAGLPLGLDKLDGEELAACFDTVCNCGKMQAAIDSRSVAK